MNRTALFLLFVASSLFPLRAFAHHGRDFLVTSSFKTADRGSLFALWSSHYINSSHHDREYEFEPGLLYGITDRWSLELHTHHGLSSGDFHTESVALETALRLFGPGEVDGNEPVPEGKAPYSLAILFEFEKGVGDEHDRYEGRIIVGKDFDNVSLMANLIGEKALAEGERLQYQFALGLKKNLTPTLGLGVEFDGGIEKEEGYGLTPGIYATIMPGLDLRVGPSIGLGNRPEDFKLRGTLLFEL